MKTNLPSLTTRAATSLGVSFVALLVASSAVSAQETPSMSELYQMLQKQGQMIEALQSQQGSLVQQAEQSKQKAKQAERELAAAKRELNDAKAQIAQNAGKVEAAEEQLANVDLAALPQAEAETVMGSQLSQSAVSVVRTPGWFADVQAGAVWVGEDVHAFGFVTINDQETGLSGNVSNLADDAGYEIAGVIGSRDTSGRETRAKFAYAHIDNSETLTVPTDFDQVLLFPGNQRVFRGQSLDEAGDFVTGDLEIEKAVLDLEKGKTLALGSHLDAQISGGARLAYLDHQTGFFASRADAPAIGIPNNTFDHRQDNELYSAGPKVAGELKWIYGNITFAGGMSAALLGSYREYSIRETEFFAGDLNNRDTNNFNEDAWFVVPVLDANAEVDVNMMIAGMPAHIAVGYQAQSWIDVIRDVKTTGDSPGDFQNLSQDLTFQGPYLRAGLIFSGMPEPVALK